jgi:hypothetical protein
VEAKAKDATAAALITQQEAAQAVAQARAVEREARHENAQQAAEAKAQVAVAQNAEAKAKDATAAAASRQQEADAQLVAARQAQAIARVAQAYAEAEAAKIALPTEWTSVADSTSIDFVEAPEKCRFFARKMRQSAKVTEDTEDAQKMDRLRVHRVVRVENAPLFESYQRERAKIAHRVEAARAAGHDVARLEEHAPDWLKAKAGFPATIDADTNESWLWHGTSATIDITNPDGTQQRVDTWEVLAKHGFDERVASDSGLYGAGSYFADASSKANQYATAQRARQPLNADGHHCMLSCRVTMGDAYMTPGTRLRKRLPPNNPATPGLPYDSVFAEEGHTDRGRPGPQFHNEYVVFAKAQVYPEYVIWYTL